MDVTIYPEIIYLESNKHLGNFLSHYKSSVYLSFLYLDYTHLDYTLLHQTMVI